MRIILFKNEGVLCDIEEQRKILYILRKYVRIVDSLVLEKRCEKKGSYEGVCYLFAKSIVEYAKASIDNLMLGYFKVSNMINRSIVENYVCFEIIFEHEKEELWKYWYVYSYFHEHDKFGKKGIPKEFEDGFKDMCERYEIDNEYFEKAIYKQYGWTYKINNDFTFKGLCEITGGEIYKDFKFGSDYTHGTLYFQKEEPISPEISIYTVITVLFIYMQFFVERYCYELLTPEYFKVRRSFYKYFDFLYEDEEE